MPSASDDENEVVHAKDVRTKEKNNKEDDSITKAHEVPAEDNDEDDSVTNASVEDENESVTPVEYYSCNKTDETNRLHTNLVSTEYMHIYNQLEESIELQLKKVFEFLQHDMKKNIPVIFCAGILSGGMFGICASTFGLGFGLNCMEWNMTKIYAVLSVILCVDCVFYNAPLSCIGTLHLGNMLFRALHDQRIDPYVASGITLGAVCSIAPELYIAVWVVMIYLYNAFSEIVR